MINFLGTMIFLILMLLFAICTFIVANEEDKDVEEKIEKEMEERNK